VCTSSGSGGGGGNVGGGGGGAGGGTVSCTPLSFSAVTFSGEHFASTSYEVTALEGASSTGDSLFLWELVWSISGSDTGAVVGQTVDVSTQGSYNNCTYCFTYASGCSNGTCTGFYYATSGQVHFSQASRADAGTVAATATGLTLQEWDTNTDAPVSGGGCYTLSTASGSASF
jgi:hypothetical protein